MGAWKLRVSYIENVEEWESDFKFSVPVTVRFSETDMYGHLNNTVPIAYFEYARIEFFKHHGLMSDWLNPEGEAIIVVADVQCDYIRQAFFDEQLRIFVKVASIGNSSVDIHYMIKNENDEITITGRTAIVQIDKQKGKGKAWTEKERALFLS